PRSRRVDGHLLDGGAEYRLCHRHRSGVHVGGAGLHLVSLHHSFRLGVPVEKLCGDHSGGTGQAVRSFGCGSAPGVAGGSGHAVHRRQLDSADRVRAVCGRTGRVSAGHLREEGNGMILRRPFFWIILLIAAGFIYAPVHGNNVSLREDLILIAIAIILASNLNLMIGYTGYVNFGHIVFYGLGGYLGLYLTTARGWNLVLSALTAGVVVTLCAFLFGLAVLRLRGAYFALATIGILEAVRAFVSNFDPWGRSTGMYLSFASYQPLGGARHALWITYFLIIAVMALSMILSLAIKNSKFGLGLFAIREDEDAAIVLGVNATTYKAIIYSVSAFLPAVAGALMFFKNGMIDPSIAFEFMLSLEGIVMLMLGGQGSVIGAALGGALYERLRSYLLTSPVLSNFHLVIAGGLLLMVVLFAPGGLIGWVYRLVPRARKVIE